MVARTVEHYIRSGVAGAHLEDQILTKRCGHLSGKKVVPREEYSKHISLVYHPASTLIGYHVVAGV